MNEYSVWASNTLIDMTFEGRGVGESISNT